MIASRSFPEAGRSYAAAVAAFLAGGGGWTELPFFAGGAAARLAATLDAQAADGAHILPGPADLLRALIATPLPAVKAVILGQDPYPTPGDAQGLAFSVTRSAKLPPSLRNIFKELAADIGCPPPSSGSLAPWAARGVLLLNTCLTVEAGRAGAHRRLGWERLADEVVRAVAARGTPAVFMLWGADARRRAALIDGTGHGLIESAHPSPLSAHAGFFGSRPFSRANAWLTAHGALPIDWELTT
ncbi:uracil-DNA glycosylase [Chelatococcus reniformis]|uniref:Uracil-DNA glycosylase n=1 Tax=Chelatococcus reniformis TaxID=1494448 RepID=A0A916UAC7_9HYPH|nr:uracil-DNA glycosylase [Chelatococcus reniformis]GGC63832.1 uracil-DNA glycosylase [Chelatococcus reniformis]